MGNIIDLTGKSFGRLVVIRQSSQRDPSTKQVKWLCICNCGTKVRVRSDALRKGSTRSCGCLNIESIRKRLTLHGMSRSSEYKSLADAISRCYNPKHAQWEYYGGRGITVCKSWRLSNGKGFKNFFRDMGPRPKGKEIDRRNNNLGYSKSNCRWVTRRKNHNNRRDNVLLTYKGKTLSLAQWARSLNMKEDTLRKRWSKGWAIDKILSTKLFK